MQGPLRKAFSTRIVAVGFILTVVGGNMALATWYWGVPPNAAVVQLIQVGVITVFLGGCGMAVQSWQLRDRQRTQSTRGNTLDGPHDGH